MRALLKQIHEYLVLAYLHSIADLSDVPDKPPTPKPGMTLTNAERSYQFNTISIGNRYIMIDTATGEFQGTGLPN